MRASVLIIAEEVTARLLRDNLHATDLSVAVRSDNASALAALARSTYDLVLLDLTETDGGGFDLIQRVRRSTTAPLVVLSDSGADEDMILGLGIGADQFITKPYEPRVLVAHVRALLRRIGEQNLSAGGIRFGEYILDTDAKVLRRGKERVPLSTKEYEVLAYLISRPGVAVTPDTIYADLWNNLDGDVTAIAVYVQRIRRKIEQDPPYPAIIQTVHGSGYRFAARIEESTPEDATQRSAAVR